MFAERGTVRTDTINSASLAGNLMSIDHRRAVTVYLPPGYETSGKRYPVIYLLHGTGDDHLNFVDDDRPYFKIQDLLEQGVRNGRFGEMIVVTPNENTPFGGSFYVNSTVTGNWEDFTVKELVAHVDQNYRTVPDSSSRAIVGHSMGGFGAMYLSMRHPDVFGVVYSLNGGFLSFTAELNPMNSEVRKFAAARTIEELLATKSQNAIGMLMVAQAFSPNPANAVFFSDKPYRMVRGRVVPNRPAYDKWTEFDLVNLAVKYEANLRKLRAIKFDFGYDEQLEIIEINNRRLTRKLTELGIEHQFEEYNGDHRNRLWGLKGRIYNEVLPFAWDNIGK